MTTTLLVPVDFSIESLNTLKLALTHMAGKKIQVVLLYAEALPDSIPQLLFYSPDKIIKTRMTGEFKEALDILKNRYESVIHSIHIELFHGFNANAFVNFYIAKKIDLIFLPKSYRLTHSKNGFNPVPIIKKSKLPYEEVDWKLSSSVAKDDQLNTLFT